MSNASVYSSEELLHEREMQRIGEERFRAAMALARSTGTLSITVPGRAMLRRTVLPTANFIAGWLDHKARNDADTGYVGDLRPLLEDLTPEVAALLGVQVALNGASRPRTLTSLVAAIGSAVEDELKCRFMARENPGLWRDLKVRTKRDRPVAKRRRMMAAGRFHECLPPKWNRTTRFRVGSLILDAIVLATDFLDVVDTPKPGKRHRHKVVYPTESFLKWLEDATDAAALACPFYMPTLEVPVPWEGPEGGGYLTDLVLSRPIARVYNEAQREALENADLSLPCRALNALQSTAWRVDEDIRQTLEFLWEGSGGAAGLPERERVPIPPKPADIAYNEESRRVYSRAAREAYRLNDERRSRRTAVGALRAVAARMADQKRAFYMPHRCDFRGRAYAVPTYLNAQGTDLARGLLRFAEGTVVSPLETDLDWLFIHAANVHGEKGSLEDRARFGRALADNEAPAIAQDPLEHRDLWETADEPFQFLAACLEIDRLTNPGPAVTTLPVHADASNNGLQLLALLAGDRTLAAATNVLPPPGGHKADPRDIYNVVAERATAALPADVRDKLPARTLPRKATKRLVMTLPYGVTEWSAQGYIRDWVRAEGLGLSAKECLVVSNVVLDEVREVCAGAVVVMDWLQELSDIVVEEAPLAWTSPSGWPVVHYYHKRVSRRIRAPLAQSVQQLAILEPTGERDARSSRQGASPNFVHSIDAAILHHALAGFQGPVAAVHDAFATTAPLMPSLLDRLRRAVVACLIDRDPLQELVDGLRKSTRRKFPDPPPKLGEIRAEEVLGSPYLYS